MFGHHLVLLFPHVGMTHDTICVKAKDPLKKVSPQIKFGCICMFEKRKMYSCETHYEEHSSLSANTLTTQHAAQKA